MGCPNKIKREGIDYCKKADLDIFLLPNCEADSQTCGYKSEDQIREEEAAVRRKEIRRQEEERRKQRRKELYQGLYGMLVNTWDLTGGATWKAVAVRLLLLVSCVFYLVTGYGVFVITAGMAMVFAAQAAMVLLAFAGRDNEIDERIKAGALYVTGLGWILAFFGILKNWSFGFLLSFIFAYFYPVMLYGVIWLIKRLRDSRRK